MLKIGIFLLFLLIYFIVKVIGIYKNEIKQYFMKSINKIRITNQGRMILSLIRKLDKLGFYKYVDKQLVEELKKKSRKSGYLFWDETQRIFKSDAEGLAEGFVEPFYKEMEQFLSKEGVRIQQFEQSNNDKYEIIINGQTYLIYDDKTDNPFDIWEIASNRTFAVINILLQEAGSKERLYSLYGGNDLFALFLTEEMFEAIKQEHFIKKVDKPSYIPEQF
jgi:hypothetical protein